MTKMSLPSEAGMSMGRCLLEPNCLLYNKVLCKDDTETLDLCKNMMKQGEWPSLMIVFYSKEGFTVEADVFIRDWTIITEYVGDADYLNNREASDENSMMSFLNTNDTSKDLVICPDKRSNIARFISSITSI
ncbi:Histone-lysine N-methyltransferase ATXR6 [Capsicum baccatum]|uniref:Histone-lysine N-methyltransferase ATXR6 n=1 Tax=Capsicum baccatum TaxID=33114 RepID=A0A2G2X695_CAPBA|nr:Histone-lysine N-methyltransferase ATXR6 [Capsicum baccatum]